MGRGAPLSSALVRVIATYRADRSALDAVKRIHKLINTGHGQIVDADLSSYFDSVPHAELMRSVARRVVDGAMLHLIKMWLEAPVEETDERGNKHRSTRNRDEGRGTPQGSPLSPLLSNLYMRRFVLGWKKLGHEERWKAYIVNYADDLVICCRVRAERALAEMRTMMSKLKLTVNESKTRVCYLPEEKFDFLGYTFGRCYSMRRARRYHPRSGYSVSVELSATRPGVTKSGKIRGQWWKGSIGC